MTFTLDTAASFGNPFTRLFKKASAAAPSVTVTPAEADVHCLRKGATLVVSHPMHCEILCRCGSLWVTHDGDPRDITLDAGQSYRADRNARMLVHALDSAELLLIERSLRG